MVFFLFFPLEEEKNTFFCSYSLWRERSFDRHQIFFFFFLSPKKETSISECAIPAELVMLLFYLFFHTILGGHTENVVKQLQFKDLNRIKYRIQIITSKLGQQKMLECHRKMYKTRLSSIWSQPKKVVVVVVLLLLVLLLLLLLLLVTEPSIKVWSISGQ